MSLPYRPRSRTRDRGLAQTLHTQDQLQEATQEYTQAVRRGLSQDLQVSKQLVARLTYCRRAPFTVPVDAQAAGPSPRNVGYNSSLVDLRQAKTRLAGIIGEQNPRCKNANSDHDAARIEKAMAGGGTCADGRARALLHRRAAARGRGRSARADALRPGPLSSALSGDGQGHAREPRQ